MNQMPFPSIEELRMLRAIALIAVAEAACIGEYRASFRGFRVHAWRINPLSPGRFVPVRVEMRRGTGVLERSDVDVATDHRGLRGDIAHRAIDLELVEIQRPDLDAAERDERAQSGAQIGRAHV